MYRYIWYCRNLLPHWGSTFASQWLKDTFCGIFFGIDWESHHSKGPLWCFVFVYIYSLTSCQFKYDTLQVRRETSWKSSVQLFNGSDLESQTCVNLVQYVSSPLLFDFPISSVFFHISTRWGSTPWPLEQKIPSVSASPRPTLIPFWVPRSLSPRHKMPMVFCWPKMARFGWCFLGGANRGATNTLGVGLKCGWVWGGKNGRIIFGGFSLLTSSILRFWW